MKRSIPILGLAVLSASLISCGGGGGSGGITPGPGAGNDITLTSPAPAATSSPQPIAVPGMNSGISFDFTGALTRSDFYNYPAANPLPASTASADIAQNVKVTTVDNPFGPGSVFDYHNVENDAYTLQTLLFTTDSFYQLKTTVSPKQLLLLGSNTVDDQKNKTSIVYTTPQIVDQIPESAKQAWTNNPAGTLKIAYANGNATDRLTNANASYNERDTYVTIGADAYPQVNMSTAMHPDGSAQIVFVFNEEGRAGYPSKSVTYTFLMSKPQSSGIKLKASIYTVPATGTPSPSPSPAAFGVAPAWFKTPLYSETNTDNGPTVIPSSCEVSPAFGTHARQIVKTVHSVDGAYGTIDDTTTTRYDVVDFGAVCVQISDVNNAFYDFSLADFTNQAPLQFFSFATALSQPLISTTITEQLTLSTHGLTSSSGRQTQSLRPIAPQTIALAEAAVARETQRARAKRLENELRQIRDALVRGGVLK